MSTRGKRESAKARPAETDAGRRRRRLLGVLKAALDRFLANDLLTGILFVGALALFTFAQHRGVSYGALEVNQVAARDYYAPFAVTVTDLENTEKLKQQASDTSPPVFRFMSSEMADGSGRLGRFFEAGRAFFTEQFGEFASPRPLTADDLAALRERLPLAVSDDKTLDYFARHRFSPELEAVLRNAYQNVMRMKVAATAPILEKASHILVLGQGGKAPFRDLDKIVVLADVEGILAKELREPLQPLSGGQLLMAAFLRRLVNPNLVPDREATERERAEAVARVIPRVVDLPKGRMIAEKGELLTQQHVSWLREIESKRAVGRVYRVTGGGLVLIGLLVLFLRRYVRVHQREFRDRRSLFGMNMIVGLGVSLLSFALLHLADVLAESIARDPFDRSLSYRFAIPVAAGALLLALLSNARMAMVFSIVQSVIFGMLAGWNLELTLYVLLGSFAGIYGITQYRDRSAILKAGLVVGGTNVLTILALAAVADPLTSLGDVLFDVSCGVVGGIFVATTASFMLPVLEWMFNVVTDIRLLELSNLNNPLLRKLAVQAPGTYNHSVIVGTLAEAAAESIGVGALLCRVAAYYHDIGKMKKPEYFIENARRGAVVRHEKLSPTMSSLIILSHVKDGSKMARDYHLPEPIVDFIEQHHGTRLIHYFFKKAKKMEDREFQEVSESNFRYPGPKPQTKEAAVLMMADSVEAAARTVEEPTPSKFKDLIRKIVNAVILDDQLSETELTFSDLDRIQRSFEVTLASIYHHRIEYPDFRFEDRPGPERVNLPA